MAGKRPEVEEKTSGTAEDTTASERTNEVNKDDIYNPENDEDDEDHVRNSQVGGEKLGDEKKPADYLTY